MALGPSRANVILVVEYAKNNKCLKNLLFTLKMAILSVI